ncbi:maestro heat-like repeat-containing protein family member 1 [Buteo buteo]
MPPRARAVRKWVFIFLVECREEIVQEVPKILNTLYSYMQQSTHRPFLLRAVFLLTRFHQEPVISSLLQKSLLMDSDTVELWRSLGRSILGIQILRCLVEKLNRAGNDRLGTDSSPCEQHSCQTALETLTITRAISEVVFALRSTEELRRLLPHLLPSLLRWASEMLGGERQLLLMTSWKQLHVEKPCRIFLSAIKLVLGKCMAQKWTQLLEIWGVWARLEVPVAHPEGVRLLTSVLLNAGVVSPCLVKNLLPWLNSCSVQLRMTATAFFAEVTITREEALLPWQWPNICLPSGSQRQKSSKQSGWSCRNSRHLSTPAVAPVHSLCGEAVQGARKRGLMRTGGSPGERSSLARVEYTCSF